MPGKSSTRRRTGCLTCRRRRVRCDEAKPTCRHCQKGNRNCTWSSGLRFVHHNGGPADEDLAIAGNDEEVEHVSIGDRTKYVYWRLINDIGVARGEQN
jgi:hypothetical protein